MSRSGYSNYLEPWALIRWRGAVNSAIKGKRGQALLRDMAAALDAMPIKCLSAHDLISEEGDVCALGALACFKGLAVRQLDPYDYDQVAAAFGVSRALVCEIEYENDDGPWQHDTPEQRWARMRVWVNQHLKAPA